MKVIDVAPVPRRGLIVQHLLDGNRRRGFSGASPRMRERRRQRHNQSQYFQSLHRRPYPRRILAV